MLAADTEQVGEPVIADVKGLDALALEHRVGRDRRAVHQLQPGDIQAHLADTLQDRPFRRLRRRQHLVHAQPAVRVERHEVGKGPAGVDTQSDHAGHCTK